MANMIKNLIKTIIILAVSIGIGFGITYVIAESSSAIANSSIPFILWGGFTIIIAFFLRGLFNRAINTGSNDAWGSPEAVRNNIVNTPQFVGRFDRTKGLLETTARMVTYDKTSYQKWYMGKPADLTLYVFRGELLDQNGSPLDYIPVEIKGDSSKWVGTIADGDRLRVNGKIEDDGILHTKKAFNFSTNSWVGEK
jgi:hypothetical protein